MSPMKRLNFTVDDETAYLINAIAAATSANKSDIVRRGVALYARQLGVEGFKVSKKKTTRQMKAKIR